MRCVDTLSQTGKSSPWESGLERVASEDDEDDCSETSGEESRIFLLGYADPLPRPEEEVLPLLADDGDAEEGPGYSAGSWRLLLLLSEGGASSSGMGLAVALDHAPRRGAYLWAMETRWNGIGEDEEEGMDGLEEGRGGKPAGFKGRRRPSGRPAEEKGVFRVHYPAGTTKPLTGAHVVNDSGRGSVSTLEEEGCFSFGYEEVESKDFVGTSRNLDRRIEDDTNMGCDTIGSKNWSNQLDMLSWRSKVDLSLTSVDTTATETFFLWTGVDLS
ncbi:hypothetical protein Taro_020618, partial [Colocasia esculenta]|nr:hypothetical protein [Colocasia esculenta]